MVHGGDMELRVAGNLGPAHLEGAALGRDQHPERGQRGARCPREVSITGFNDITFADRFAPPLTTVRIPHRVMGEQAARLLLAEIEDPQAPKQEIKLAPSLVVRGSTAPPRTKARRP